MPVWNNEFSSDGGDVLGVQLLGFSGTTPTVARFDSVGRRVANQSVTAPTVVAGAAAGTGPTVSVVGTDEVGTITVNVGTSPATGTLVTLTFNYAYANTPYVAGLVCRTASPSVHGSTTTTTLVLTADVALTASTTYKFDYHAIGA
jgi:hypothetical protein